MCPLPLALKRSSRPALTLPASPAHRQDAEPFRDKLYDFKAGERPTREEMDRIDASQVIGPVLGTKRVTKSLQEVRRKPRLDDAGWDDWAGQVLQDEAKAEADPRRARRCGGGGSGCRITVWLLATTPLLAGSPCKPSRCPPLPLRLPCAASPGWAPSKTGRSGRWAPRDSSGATASAWLCCLAGLG